MSCFLTHAAGLIILSICYCAHSILVRGVYLDAEEPGAKAGVLSYSYIRYFLRVSFNLNYFSHRKHLINTYFYRKSGQGMCLIDKRVEVKILLGLKRILLIMAMKITVIKRLPRPFRESFGDRQRTVDFLLMRSKRKIHHHHLLFCWMLYRRILDRHHQSIADGMLTSWEATNSKEY